MSPIRVLLVGHPIAVRRFLAASLRRDPALVVVGTASSGAAARRLISTVRPDVVTWDHELALSNGVEALAPIREQEPDLPVIVVSATGPLSASESMALLALGRTDVVWRTGTPPGTDDLEPLSRALVEKIKSVRSPGRRALPATSRPSSSESPRAGVRPEIVLVGCSTGGPDALVSILEALPGNFPVPILIAQHMPPLFTHYLAVQLEKVTRLRVAEAESGAKLEPGQVWVAPGRRHLVVSRRDNYLVAGVHDGPAENSCRPSVDVLLRSAVEACGGAVLALVLTGMGQDGQAGSAAVRAAGGQVWVQDGESSAVWGMPGSVVQAGLADRVLPLSRIGSELVRCFLGEGPRKQSNAEGEPCS
jgi:two-component system, chemotaxis family, protein-glutamate methylesterase/glutaminase